MKQYNDAFAFYINRIFNKKQQIKAILMTLTLEFLVIQCADRITNNKSICWLSIFHNLSKL